MTDPIAYNKPLPRVDDPTTAPFWEALRERKLRMPRCTSCGHVRWPAAPLCPECLSPDREWTEVRAAGELWSYVVYHRAFHPGFVDDLPYTVAKVILDDGPSLTAQITGPVDISDIGQRVEGVFEDVTGEVTLLRFAVVREEG